MITIAVQIQLQHSQAPKWRPSSILAEAARICYNSCCGECVGGEGALISTALPAQAMRYAVALGYTAADLVLFISSVSLSSPSTFLCIAGVVQ
jgi:hypothetical protein